METSVRSVALVALSLVLVGCSSLRKQADEQFEKGAYEEALQLYEQALVESPSDADASAGLRKTRIKLIDKRLLTVRHTRLGGNSQGALDLLSEVVADETAWKVFPDGPVSSTQDEESESLFPFFRGQVDTAFKKSRPLRVHYLVEHYRPVFQGTKQRMLDAMSSRAATLGKTSCSEIAAYANESVPYYAQFLAKACGLWGFDTTSLQRTARAKFGEFYRKVDAKVRVNGVDDGIEEMLEKVTEEAFRQSPWFDANGGKSATIAMSGAYARAYTERSETRSHSYTVSIPYTDYETVTRTRYVSNTTYVPSCSYDYVTGREQCHDVPQSSSQPLSYTERVPVTRYRTEPRVQSYEGTYETQTLSLRIGGQARFGTLDRKLTYAERSKTEGFRHDWSIPSIGLNPEPSKLADPEQWLANQALGLGQEVLSASVDAWQKLYCRPLAAKADMAAIGNQAHRCLRAPPESVPAFVTAWYTNHFGVTPEQAATLFALNDF